MINSPNRWSEQSARGLSPTVLTVSLSILACTIPGPCAFLSAEIIDRVAISVANQVITESQIEEEVRLTAFLNQEPVKLDADEKKKAAGRLIEQTLVRREIKFIGYPSPGIEEADAALKELREGYESDAEFRRMLHAYGITEDALKQRLWWQATLLGFIDYRFRPGIQIPDADIEASYKEQLAKWQREGVKETPTLEDSRANIEQALTEQRIDQALDRWLSETRAQVAIRYHDEALR